MKVNCKICGSESKKIFDKIILQKYKSNYYQCSGCNFLQTDEVIWLDQAYNFAITALDIGLISRNNQLKDEVSLIIDCCFPDAKTMIDYAGGYGNFVRLMRDAGYNFFRQDDYCENIFTKHFDVTDTNIKKFDIVTGFEVLEHFNDPLNDIAKIFAFSENAVFSTELVPQASNTIENWWYIAQETGQHIAFYSKKTMQLIAEKFNKNYYCRNGNIHVFTAKPLTDAQINYAINNKKKQRYFFGLLKKKIHYKIERESLLQRDYDYIKGLLNSK